MLASLARKRLNRSPQGLRIKSCLHNLPFAPKKKTLNKHSSSAIGVTSAEIVKDKVVEDKAGRQFRELKGCMNKENALILIYEVGVMVHFLLPSG